jgi:transcriptional regulator with XRE-family HTH domain
VDKKQTKATKADYKLGKRLQHMRKVADLTQEELAEKIHTSSTWVTYIETGREIPNLKMLQKIARALGIKVKDLIPF